MFSRSAELYDRIYLGLKDYPAEAAKINELILAEQPNARDILDAACGTGEHAKILGERYGFSVDGFDLDPKLLALAQSKSPRGTFRTADMVEVDLGRTYDVVMCLFSSIGYVKTLPRVKAALQRFERHLRAGGLMIVEPWFPPGVLSTEKIFMVTSEAPDLKIVRMARNEIKDRVSILHFEYLVGTPASIEHEVEAHELGLFTIDEMLQSFREAGLDAVYREGGLSGRGLYLARR